MDERDEFDTINKKPAIARARADIEQSESASPASTLGDYVVFVDESREACLDPIDSRFISKQANLEGHQLCDLLARPIAKSSFDRNSHQRPIQIIQTKLIAHKIFPQTVWQRPTRSRPSFYFNGYTRVNPSANDSHAPR